MELTEGEGGASEVKQPLPGLLRITNAVPFHSRTKQAKSARIQTGFDIVLAYSEARWTVETRLLACRAGCADSRLSNELEHDKPADDQSCGCKPPLRSQGGAEPHQS